MTHADKSQPSEARMETVVNLSEAWSGLSKVVGVQLREGKIVMPCGSSYDLRGSVLSGVNIPCDCGDSRHIVVEWVK